MAHLQRTLKYYLTLRLETETIMNGKYKVVTEPTDDKWLWNLALQCDIRHHTNNLSTKLQGQHKPNFDMSEIVTALEINLTLLQKQTENVNQSHFSSCDGWINAAKIIDSREF